MAQHFLLSAKARSLSLKAVFRMSDEAAYDTFRKLRWPETDGDAVCPRCGCVESYDISTRRRFKCVACHHQFSVTSGTIFASRKMAFVDLLAAIAIFVNGAKGVSALQLSRDLDCQYKTAFVLTHKLREAMSRELAGLELNGVVEIDGAYFGGHVRPENRKEDRKDRRLKAHRSDKRQCIVVMRGARRPFAAFPSGERRRCRALCARSRRNARHHSCRRRRGLGRATRGLGYEARQSLRRVHGRRRVHQSGRKLLFPAFAARRSALTIISPAPTSTPMLARWLGGRTIAAGPMAHRRRC